jgi:hypothetical protein
MSQEHNQYTIGDKNRKNKVPRGEKLSVTFDTAMSTVYENTLFLTLVGVLGEIHGCELLPIGDNSFLAKGELFAWRQCLLSYIIRQITMR